MPSARELLGSIVELLFYFGIASTLVSFTTHLFAHEINNPGIDHNASTISFIVVGNTPYGDDKETAFNPMTNAINQDHDLE